MLEISPFLKYKRFMSDVATALVCAVLFSWMVLIKEPLLLIRKSSPVDASMGFLSMSGPLSCVMPYNCKCVECVVKSNISYFFPIKCVFKIKIFS